MSPGNQRWGVASSCQRAPIFRHCQRRIEAGGRVIAARGAGRPELRRRARDGAEIIAVEFVEAGATQAELVGGGGGGDFVAAEGGEEFTDQRRTETMGELTIMFFKAARMREQSGVGERGAMREPMMAKSPICKGGRCGWTAQQAERTHSRLRQARREAARTAR